MHMIRHLSLYSLNEKYRMTRVNKTELVELVKTNHSVQMRRLISLFIPCIYSRGTGLLKARLFHTYSTVDSRYLAFDYLE